MKDKIKNPVGRPAMSKDEKRLPRSIKLSDAEWQELKDLAGKEGISVAEYIRQKTIKAGD